MEKARQAFVVFVMAAALMFLAAQATMVQASDPYPCHSSGCITDPTPTPTPTRTGG